MILSTEPLKDRTLLTDLSGVINTDMSFMDPNDTINIVGDVFVRNGATLTFGPGVVVQESSSFNDLVISDDGSGVSWSPTGPRST